MARLLYKPFGLFFTILGGIVAGAIFKRAWGKVVREEDPPKPTDEQKGWGEVLVAGAAKGAVSGGVKAAVNRAGATGFARFTGEWPGPKKS